MGRPAGGHRERSTGVRVMAGITAGGQQTAAAIRREAAASFVQHGYEATSLRNIAAAVGIKVGSLYNHITSKEDLLLSVMGGTMDDLNSLMDEALDGPIDPVDRLIAFVECHIRFHAERAQEVFIGNTELRSLHAEARAELSEKRREYRKLLESLIVAVGEADEADILNARLHAFSIVAIGTHVAGWYREDGGLPLDEIIEIYTTMVLRSLRVDGADERVRTQLAAGR
ncbi:AcrR family transcriptional regulator [Microbacterium sp. W4I4]|uniref:TetR/AcrR family transcriptional regulator n=1 Tax=Microbacterium sp. W4I4 TaxID=3042295 RepID=UPI002785844C|nr:TetR/AcrR family transcriptional regulator [Microbacterium sp. W4I4]MDQ0615151.1 AcrR family transcriptional regulator [Microbacterium sp. W4I4]